MTDRKYKLQIEQVNEPTYSCESNCNEIMFVNQGVASPTVTINKFPLQGGAFITFGGNQHEEDVTVYRVEGNTSGTLWIFRKIFNS